MIWAIAFLFLLATPAEATHAAAVKDMEALHELACSSPQSGKGPWNVSNLYDCESRKLFIPYQLWTGSKWDGNKDAPCMHPANIVFDVYVSSANKWRTRTIKGPKEWQGEQVWVRETADGSKTQYFECHPKGIGRLWEVRKGREKTYRRNGRCKFPAGYGWEIGKRRKCVDTALQVYRVEFDRDHNLSALEFTYWFRITRRRGEYSSEPRYRLNFKYRYVPHKGMETNWRQDNSVERF